MLQTLSQMGVIFILVILFNVQYILKHYLINVEMLVL